MQRQALFGARTIRFCSDLALALPAVWGAGRPLPASALKLAADRVPTLLHRPRRRILTRARPVIGKCQFKGRRAVDNLHRSLALAALMAAWLLSGASAMAQDSSPYVVGHWRLNDSFQDFKPGAPITTDNTDFIFLNPTDLTLTLEYAFFAAPDGTFCGCDRDILSPNGRTRYTMLGEKQGGQFSTRLCPTQTEGALKAIVFTSPPGTSPIVVGDALQAGVQIHIFGSAPGQRSESNLQGVTINPTTTREMNAIHTTCEGFIK
jgi:hypothetical protein